MQQFKKAIIPHRGNAAIKVNSIDDLITAHDALLAIEACREEHGIAVSDLGRHAFKRCGELITRHRHLKAFVAELRHNQQLLHRVRARFRAFDAVEALYSPDWWPKDAQRSQLLSESDRLQLQVAALHRALDWVEAGTAVATWSRHARADRAQPARVYEELQKNLLWRALHFALWDAHPDLLQATTAKEEYAFYAAEYAAQQQQQHPDGTGQPQGQQQQPQHVGDAGECSDTAGCEEAQAEELPQVDSAAAVKLYHFLHSGFWRGLQADALVPILVRECPGKMDHAVCVLRAHAAMRASWLGQNTKPQAAAAAEQLLALSSSALNGGICGFLAAHQECQAQGVIQAAAQALGFTPAAASVLEAQLLHAFKESWQRPADLPVYDVTELHWAFVPPHTELPMPDEWAADLVAYEDLLHNAPELVHIQPAGLCTSMVVSMKFSSISTDLLVEYLAVHGYDLSAAAGLSDPHQWRSHGLLRQAADIILVPPDPKLRGEVLLVPTADGLPAPHVRARVYNSGTVQLLGCKSYSQAVTAFSKLLDLFQAAAAADEAVQVPAAVPGSAAVHNLNVQFSMPPLSQDNCMGKGRLHEHVRSQPAPNQPNEPVHVHGGASDGRGYVTVYERPNGVGQPRQPQLRVFRTGTVQVWGCRSMADALRLSHWMQVVVDSRFDWLRHDEDTPLQPCEEGAGTSHVPEMPPALPTEPPWPLDEAPWEGAADPAVPQDMQEPHQGVDGVAWLSVAQRCCTARLDAMVGPVSPGRSGCDVALDAGRTEDAPWQLRTGALGRLWQAVCSATPEQQQAAQVLQQMASKRRQWQQQVMQAVELEQLHKDAAELVQLLKDAEDWQGQGDAEDWQQWHSKVWPGLEASAHELVQELSSSQGTHAAFRKQLPAAAAAAAAQAHEVSTDAAHLCAVTEECSRLSAALGAHAGVVSSSSGSVRVCLAPSESAHSWQRLLVLVPTSYPQQPPTLVCECHPGQLQQPALAHAAWDEMQLRVWQGGVALATLQQIAESWLDVVCSIGS